MSLYKQIQKTFQKEYKERSPAYRARISEWRKQSPIVRVEKPTNLARARTLGYKAKDGFVIVRVRVKRGKRKREIHMRGRKPSKTGRFYSRHKSLQLIAEERAGRKFRNLEVLNSYFVGEDGQYKFYEVILVDPEKTGLKLQKGRVFRGLTSQGRKMRGLR
ncbi:MAG: 50S ribosomal protein L15e [Candidatus Micrarchaeia archaeon]